MTNFTFKKNPDGPWSVLCNGRDTGLIVRYQPYRDDWAFLLGGSDEQELIAADTLLKWIINLSGYTLRLSGRKGMGND
jgi:hypothetical protein